MGSTIGYNFASAGGITTISGFSPSGVICAAGYTGTVVYVACSSTGSPYSVSGCQANMCTLSSTTGYNTGSCDAASSAKTVAGCTLTCAPGYTAAGITAVGCSSNNGHFSITNPCQANSTTTQGVQSTTTIATVVGVSGTELQHVLMCMLVCSIVLASRE